jgi:hypothetical protein
MSSLKAQEHGESEAAIAAMLRGNTLTNSISALSGQYYSNARLPVHHPQKSNPTINIQLWTGEEVLGRLWLE